MNKELLRRILALKRDIYILYVQRYGADHEISMEIQNSLSRIITLLAISEGRHKI